MPRFICLCLCAGALLTGLGAPFARAALKPEILGEGTLLRSAVLPEGYEVGVYGPRDVGGQESISVTVLVMGNEAARLAAGAVLMAARRDEVSVSESLPPGAEFVPPGEWSPERESGWALLLHINPRAFWATRLATFAPVSYGGSAARILDRVLLEPDRPRPPDASPFRDWLAYSQVGAAFALHEPFLADTVSPAGSPLATAQAYAVKVRFHAQIRNPGAALNFWVCLIPDREAASRVVSLVVPLTPLQGERPPLVTAPDSPIVWEPTEGAAMGERVRVTGITRPGALAVAWIELRDPAQPDRPLNDPPQRIRQFADSNGNYGFEVPRPSLPDSLPARLRCELHVRAEAPGFPAHPELAHDTIIPLTLAP